MSFRKEQDSLGEVRIPADRLWGAQTQRALQNFRIGDGSREQMPIEMIHALALIKKSAARANESLSLLDSKKAKAIIQSADEILAGQHNTHFPLGIWQSGSGTQSNMNVNEVIANRAIQILKGKIGDKSVHPNDDVNQSQSSNDVFPTAMHITAVQQTHHLIKSLTVLEKSLSVKAKEFSQIIKTGRTHLMDAAPLSLGQEFSAWAFQVKENQARLNDTLKRLYPLTLGGTAVGTGLNAPKGFAEKAIAFIAEETQKPFVPAKNLFAGSSAHDALAELSGVLKILAVSLMKIGNDIRLMASGPRTGLNEIFIPANEPGSSIMPGKVNPTQCEALTMVCAEVMGNDTAVALGCASGHFELNVFKPLIISNLLRSLRLLSDTAESFEKNCVKGIRANKEKLKEYTDRSLMLVTALNTHIGYDKCAQIAKQALEKGTTLKEAALQSGFVTEKEFDQLVQPKNMLGQQK